MALTCVSAVAADEQVLFGFDDDFDIGTIEARDAAVSRTPQEVGAALRLSTGHNIDWPGITLKAPQERWDLSERQYVSVDVRNAGGNEATICLRVDNPGADGTKNCVQVGLTLGPRESGVLMAMLSPAPWRLTAPVEFIGMRGTPGVPGEVDPANITQLVVFVPKPSTDHVFEIDNICAGGRAETLDTSAFFPFIDEFGQFMHAEWPGKTHSVEDLRAHAEQEAIDLSEHAGPADWNAYGGWEAGPQLEATGFFRVEKHRGRWWLVDPNGRLFWSHGIDCVGPWGGSTPVTDRRHYFQGLPAPDSPLAGFWGRGSGASRGYYRGK
ncbi:MAG: beta-agarase, partial [Planctomycetota bacterium]